MKQANAAEFGFTREHSLVAHTVGDGDPLVEDVAKRILEGEDEESVLEKLLKMDLLSQRP